MRFAFLAFLFTVLMFPLTAQAAMPGVPENGQLAFTVTRNGTPIGRQTYIFEGQGSQQTVRVQTRILYVLVGIPFYRFEHDSIENWEKGRLIDLTSTTNDDGKQLELAVKAVGPDLQATLNGQGKHLEKTNLPASLWNPATPKAGSLIDTVDGKQLDIVAQGQGRHVILSGGLNRKIWYDEQGILAEVHFLARDGSEIRYLRD